MQKRSRFVVVGACATLAVAGLFVAVTLARGGSSPKSQTSSGFVGGDFHSLVAHPVVSGRLYVGGHQAVSTSTDGGATWAEVAALSNADAMGWAMDGETVWVSGHPGIVKSSDGALTFTAGNAGLPDTDIHALGGNGKVVYAAGPSVGVLRSSDGGVTWSTASTTVGRSFFGRMLIDGDDPNRVVAADPTNGVLESRDGGATWKQLTATGATWVSSPDGLRTLYASGVAGAARSVDGGTDWQALALPSTATLVESDPTTPHRLYAGVLSHDRVTVWTSTDDGTTWNKP